jgi:activating signal cointegrator 1
MTQPGLFEVAKSKPMRALSLTQPWATAIITGVKQIETRSWQTPFRGVIAIHAAKGFPGWAKEFAMTENTLGRLPDRLPLGAIIGVAKITDIKRTEEIVTQISAIERLYGDYSFGRFGWFLSDVIALPEPIPCRGALSLWEVPIDIRPEIQKHL